MNWKGDEKTKIEEPEMTSSDLEHFETLRVLGPRIPIEVEQEDSKLLPRTAILNVKPTISQDGISSLHRVLHCEPVTLFGSALNVLHSHFVRIRPPDAAGVL